MKKNLEKATDAVLDIIREERNEGSEYDGWNKREVASYIYRDFLEGPQNIVFHELCKELQKYNVRGVIKEGIGVSVNGYVLEIRWNAESVIL